MESYNLHDVCLRGLDSLNQGFLAGEGQDLLVKMTLVLVLCKVR